MANREVQWFPVYAIDAQNYLRGVRNYQVAVYLEDGSLAPFVYNEKGQQVSNPFSATIPGTYIGADPGTYEIVFSTSGGVEFRRQKVLFLDNSAVELLREIGFFPYLIGNDSSFVESYKHYPIKVGYVVRVNAVDASSDVIPSDWRCTSDNAPLPGGATPGELYEGKLYVQNEGDNYYVFEYVGEGRVDEQTGAVVALRDDMLSGDDDKGAGMMGYRQFGSITDRKVLQKLQRPQSVDLEEFGGGTDKTPEQNSYAAEEAMDKLEQRGGGVLNLGLGVYNFGASPNTGVYEIGGLHVLGSSVGIVKRPNVSLRGIRGGTIFRTTPEYGGILLLSPDGGFVEGINFDGGWVQGASHNNKSGLITAMPSDSGRTNLVSPGTFSDSTEGWVSEGDITLSTAGGRLRAMYGASGGGMIYKPFPTVIGGEYRVRCIFYNGTTPVNTIRASLSETPGSEGRFFSQLVGFPEGNYSKTFTFTAVSEITYIQIDNDVISPGDLIGSYFEIDNICITLFPLVEQKLHIRDFTIDSCDIYGWASYCVGFEDGDIINSGLRHVRMWEAGADAFDSKQRGPSRLNRGLFVSDSHAARFGLRVDGQAGFDFHGVANVSNVTVFDFGREDTETIGVRFRTFAPQTIPYEGTQAAGSRLFGAQIKANPVGTTYGVQIGSPDCHVIGVHGEGGTHGIGFVGNTYGNSEKGDAVACTWKDAANYNFITNAPDVKLVGCHSYRAGTAGYRNTASNVRYIGCDDSGSSLAEAHTIQPERIASISSYTGGGTVTQDTSKTNAVTINRQHGSIRTHNAELAAGASVIFRVNCSVVRSVDIVSVAVRSPVNSYTVEVIATLAGAFNVRLTNITDGALSEQVIINYVLIAGGENA